MNFDITVAVRIGLFLICSININFTADSKNTPVKSILFLEILLSNLKFFLFLKDSELIYDMFHDLFIIVIYFKSLPYTTA